jgi:hypothetical protein
MIRYNKFRRLYMSDFAEGYAVGQSNNGMAGLGEGGWIWIILLH